MNVKSLEKKENSTMELAVEIRPEAFEQALTKAYHKKKGSIVVPGFRKGKAPRKIIEGMYGSNVFYEDAFEILSTEAYGFAMEQESLKVVGQPFVHDIDVSDDKTVTITFLLSIYPEVEMGQYKDLTAEKPAVRVRSQEVDAEIDGKRQENARMVTAERPAQTGDIVDLDFEGFIDGVPFEGGKGEHYKLELGSGQFIPGFEDQLIGVSAGESRDVQVSFPADYAPELAGKAAVFKTLAHEIKEKLLPDVDDEFAKDVSEFETLEAYKKDIHEKIRKKKETENNQKFREAIMKQVLDNTKADVPDAMVQQQLDRMIEEYSRNIEAQGVKFEQYLAMMGMDMPGFRNSHKAYAEEQVKRNLALTKIVELEGIEASEEELSARYQAMAEAYSIAVEKIQSMLPAEMIAEDIKLEKAEKLIFDTAKTGKAAEAAKTKKTTKTESSDDKPKKTTKKKAAE